MCSGKFLKLTKERSLELANDFESADESTVFCFRASKDKIEPYEDEEPDSMCDPDIKYSESLVVLQHIVSGLWVTYQAQDNTVKLGKQVRRAIVHPEGHMDDAFAVTRSQSGESKTAMVILRTVTLLKVFIKNINSNLKEIKKFQSDKPGVHFKTTKMHLEVELEPVQLLTQDSLDYFNPPPGKRLT